MASTDKLRQPSCHAGPDGAPIKGLHGKGAFVDFGPISLSCLVKTCFGGLAFSLYAA